MHRRECWLQGLKEDEPCPVCGAIHHPTLAVIPQETPDREVLKQAKAEDEKARESVSRLSEKAHQLVTQENEKMSAVLKDAGELLGEPDVRMSLNEIKTGRQKGKRVLMRREGKNIKIRKKKRKRIWMSSMY